MKKLIYFLIIALLMAFSCSKDVEILEKQNYIQANVNGIDFHADIFLTLSFYFDNQFKSTMIRGESEGKYLKLEFYRNDLLNGNYNFHYTHPTDSSGIIGSYCDLAEMTNPENSPTYYSIFGKINISKIDTGTFESKNDVIMNLEATFNFKTDSLHGNPKTIENGEIYFKRN